MDVRGKIVLVTGASQGIGAALARALGLAGARVVLVARTQAKLDAVAGDIADKGGEAHVFPCDLSDAAAVGLMASAVREQVGTPDCIVNNAGAGRFISVEECEPDEAVFMMGAPYFAAFYVTRALLTPMIERGSGLIVNVQSPASRLPWPGSTPYAAARFALRGFSEGLRGDLLGTGLNVTEVVLGEVESDYFTNNPGSHERLPSIAKIIPVCTSDQAAAYLMTAIRREPRVMFRPFMVGLIVLSLQVCPPLVRWLVNSTGWRRSP